MTQPSYLYPDLEEMEIPFQAKDTERYVAIYSHKITNELRQLERLKKQTEYNIKCYEADIKVAKGLGWRCKCRDNGAKCLMSDDPIYVDNFNEWKDLEGDKDLECKNCGIRRLPCYERGAKGLGHPSYDVPFKQCEKCDESFDIRTDKYVVDKENCVRYCINCESTMGHFDKLCFSWVRNRTEKEIVDWVDETYGKWSKSKIADEFNARDKSYKWDYESITKKRMLSWIVVYVKNDTW